MFQRALQRISGQHLFMLLLLMSAILQPAHTTNHNLQAVSFHADGHVLTIGDSSSLDSLREHHEKHDNELCGQCQFGFMGDGIQSTVGFSGSYNSTEYALSQSVTFIKPSWFITRNRGPPTS